MILSNGVWGHVLLRLVREHCVTALPIARLSAASGSDFSFLAKPAARTPGGVASKQIDDRAPPRLPRPPKKPTRILRMRFPRDDDTGFRTAGNEIDNCLLLVRREQPQASA